MPKVDGMQLLRTVKARWPEVNVIMITGYGTIRSAVEAMKSGAFDYVSKPFTSEVLAGVAARALGLTSIHREKKTPILYLPTIFEDLNKEDLGNMWCIPEHAWVMKCEDGTCKIGLDAVYYRLMGKGITTVELPEVGNTIKQGEACVVLTAKGREDIESLREVKHNLWCPLSGVIVKINDDLKNNLLLLKKSPYSQGWLISLKPSNMEEDLENLKPFKESIGGNAAQKHLNRVFSSV